MNKSILISIFALLVLAQLYVPTSMILEKEDVLSSGQEFKFKTAPIDPHDLFRGKYIYLNFQANEIEVQSTKDYVYDENMYAIITKDSNGYAKIQSISKATPSDTENYVKIRVRNFFGKGNSQRVVVGYPFDRYYMEESKAPVAERAYNELNRDSTQIAYALVSIKNGESVLKDVLINGVPIKEIAKKMK